MILHSYDDLLLIRQLYKKELIVLCHGCFDLFHYGHLMYLKESSKLGDVLVVSVTNNNFVNKGHVRPVFDIHQRLEIINELKCVSYCCLSNSYTSIEIIKNLKPNIYCKGEDVKGKELDPKENLFHEVNELTEIGGKLVFIDKTPSVSSTEIVKVLNSTFSI